MLLDAWDSTDPIFSEQIRFLGSGQLLTADNQFRYRSFFSQTDHYYESESHLFVHAGFDFNVSDPFVNIERMLMIREFEYHSAKAHDKTIVRGHFPMKLSEIENQIERKAKIVSLDNGCVYPEREDMGNLIAFEVKSNQLIKQKNRD